MSQVAEELTGVEGGVVVGTDVSEGGRAALRFAMEEAARRGCVLHVVRAWSLASAPRPADVPFGTVPSMGEYERAVSAELAQEIAEVQASLPEAAGLDLRRHVVHAAAAKLLVAASEVADLLVVGARGRGGFAGLLLGGISDQVVRFSRCPVTVVPAARQQPPT